MHVIYEWYNSTGHVRWLGGDRHDRLFCAVMHESLFYSRTKLNFPVPMRHGARIKQEERRSIAVVVVSALSLCPSTTLGQMSNPWGESLFGEVFRTNKGSEYCHTGVNDVRHAGWSWSSVKTMTPPWLHAYFPPGEMGEMESEMWGCHDITDECHQVGGAMFGDLCMEDPENPFTAIAPGCWNRTCRGQEFIATDQTTCTISLGGVYTKPISLATIETTDNGTFDRSFVGGSWCFVPGKHTVLGPACYGDECFTEELQKVCASVNGIVYADLYCVMRTEYTVIGPICNPESTAVDCFPETTVEICTGMGGTTVGDIFCILEGEYSALGPFCFTYESPLGTSNTHCFADEGSKACTALGGTSFGDGLFCAIPGHDYHMFGAYGGGGCTLIGDEQEGPSPCMQELNGMSLGKCACIFKGDYTVGAPVRWGDTSFRIDRETPADSFALDVDVSMGFILKGSYTVYGPSCYGTACYPASSECVKAGGTAVGGIFCAMPNFDSAASENGWSVRVIVALSVFSVMVFTLTRGRTVRRWLGERLSPST